MTEKKKELDIEEIKRNKGCKVICGIPHWIGNTLKMLLGIPILIFLSFFDGLDGGDRIDELIKKKVEEKKKRE